ncbi:MAG: hypothetical protein HYS46_04485 [Betaproteobacteria bacterium]|nr:hypothetical protein [Betaproteobacteria bacterium]
MSSDVSLHVLYKVANAPINEFPFPHIYVRDVFPQDFYRELRAHLPPPEAFKTLHSLGRVDSSYPETRLVLPLTGESVGALGEPYRSFWDQLARWMLNASFGPIVLSRFTPFLDLRFGDSRARKYHDEALLVQDYTAYSLGPHTDTPMKVMSFLFYLPPDDTQSHLGTSIYVPRDPGFFCPGGPHHPFDLFNRMQTMPFLPNTLFAFMKTPNSFHGVEPIAEGNARRDLLLYDIKVENPPELAQQAPPARQPVAAPKVSFSF